jgi:hypothetical protein
MTIKIEIKFNADSEKNVILRYDEKQANEAYAVVNALVKQGYVLEIVGEVEE